MAYCLMKAASPIKMEPQGAPSPLLRQTVTEEKPCAKRLAGIPVAAEALNNLAPSK